MFLISRLKSFFIHHIKRKFHFMLITNPKKLSRWKQHICYLWLHKAKKKQLEGEKVKRYLPVNMSWHNCYVIKIMFWDNNKVSWFLLLSNVLGMKFYALFGARESKIWNCYFRLALIWKASGDINNYPLLRFLPKMKGGVSYRKIFY